MSSIRVVVGSGPMSPEHLVGLRLRARRLGLGLSMADVESRTDGVVTARQILFYEGGKHALPPLKARALADVLGEMASICDPCERDDDPLLVDVMALQRAFQAKARRR
jgi:transcriptional regulator with XRE-family HTH domain